MRILYRFGLTEDHLWKAVQITKNAHKAPGSQPYSNLHFYAYLSKSNVNKHMNHTCSRLEGIFGSRLQTRAGRWSAAAVTLLWQPDGVMQGVPAHLPDTVTLQHPPPCFVYFNIVIIQS